MNKLTNSTTSPKWVSLEDDRVWETLKALMGANLISIDRPYLYGVIDFEKWLAELERESP